MPDMEFHEAVCDRLDRIIDLLRYPAAWTEVKVEQEPEPNPTETQEQSLTAAMPDGFDGVGSFERVVRHRDSANIFVGNAEYITVAAADRFVDSWYRTYQLAADQRDEERRKAHALAAELRVMQDVIEKVRWANETPIDALERLARHEFERTPPNPARL